MFFRIAGNNGYDEDTEIPEQVKALIPHNVDLIYWDYYSQDKAHYHKQIKAHNALKEGIWFAGGLWTWAGFAPHNAYSLLSTGAAISACLDNGVKDVFFTMWGDNGGECSKYALIPSLYYASKIAKGETDGEKIKAGFKEKFGISFDEFMLLDLFGTPTYNEEKVVNPEKYMLYNDLFAGLMDYSISADDGEKYKECAERLAAFENTEYGYLFKTMRTLCEALALKIPMGTAINEAYHNKDKEALRQLAEKCDALLEAVNEFYNAFKEQWMTDNKPQGFNVQDIRLGGLMQRIKHCKEMLLDFVNGKTEEIAEIEERRPVKNGGEPVWSTSWSRIVTVNNL